MDIGVGGGDLVMCNFSGRTVFENLKAHNMVGHGDLGVKVDLRALRNANPDSVKWIPDSFPAAKCCVWLTDDNMCHCNQFKQTTAAAAASLEDPDVLKIVPKLLRKRCACTIKCLVFPTGRVVMTGGRNMSDINSVFYRMKALAPHFEVGTTIDILVPKDYQVKKKKDDVVISGDAAVDFLLESIYTFKPKRIKRRAVNNANVLLTFAEYGRLSNVKETLSILQTEGGDELEYVEEAVSKLSSLERTPEQTIILDFLKSYIKLY
jgi:TATA-box binding protein (TBP) (component of TFIID and TFIIIB)